MEPFEYRPPGPGLRVLYSDKDIVVVDKPAGLLSVPGRGANLADSVLSRLQCEHPTALTVHRLDMDTSGVMVFALRRKAEKELKRQFREREVEKTYTARVWGLVEPEEGVIAFPLAHDLENKPKSKVCLTHGKASETRYRVMERDQETTWLTLMPVTGRSHQLRVHMMALGHPILGDRFYSSGAALTAASRLMLHASTLSVKQPYQGQRLQFESPHSALVD